MTTLCVAPVTVVDRVPRDTRTRKSGPPFLVAAAVK